MTLLYRSAILKEHPTEDAKEKSNDKNLFENAEELLSGIEEIKRILNIEPVSEGYDFRITAKQAEDKAALQTDTKILAPEIHPYIFGKRSFHRI